MKGIDMEANKKRWLTPKELEKEYCFSQSVQAKMRMLSSKKKIPFSKIGTKFIRYDRFEIDKWLELNKVISLNHSK
jgi:predicted DNA-binding transcriptional regulator AlpA